MTSQAAQPILMITGAMAAGKSTIAQRLAERTERSVHLRGDAFRRMVVRGRAEMSASPSPEAFRQLRLRYQAAAQTAKLYSDAGFTVIYQDVVIGPLLEEVVAMYRGHPLHLVVLCPSTRAIARRERGRAKTAYGSVTIEQLQRALDDTPRLGLWIDSSDQSVDQTTEEILDKLPQARVVDI